MYADTRGGPGPSAGSSTDRPFYPVIGHTQQHQNSRPTPPPQPRQAPPPPPSPPDGGSGLQNPLLRVQIAAPYRTMPPVLLRPGLDQITRTQASFDFELERRVLSENGAGQGAAAAHAPLQAVDDPFQLVLERYMQMGYEREEAAMALAAHDGQEAQGQVIEFCRQYRQLKSMGFAPPLVAGALMRHRDDLAAATEACLSAQGA